MLTFFLCFIFFLNICHPEVFSTYAEYTILYSQTQQSLIYYLLDSGDMFRFHWNYRQTLLQKCIDPLMPKMRYGIPEAYI